MSVKTLQREFGKHMNYAQTAEIVRDELQKAAETRTSQRLTAKELKSMLERRNIDAVYQRNASAERDQRAAGRAKAKGKSGKIVSAVYFIHLLHIKQGTAGCRTCACFLRRLEQEKDISSKGLPLCHHGRCAQCRCVSVVTAEMGCRTVGHSQGIVIGAEGYGRLGTVRLTVGSIKAFSAGM